MGGVWCKGAGSKLAVPGYHSTHAFKAAAFFSSSTHTTAIERYSQSDVTCTCTPLTSLPDPDDDGVISLQDWVHGLNHMNTGLSYEDMHDLFDEADADEHHLMSKEAFIELVVSYAESHMVDHHD